MRSTWHDASFYPFEKLSTKLRRRRCQRRNSPHSLKWRTHHGLINRTRCQRTTPSVSVAVYWKGALRSRASTSTQTSFQHLLSATSNQKFPVIIHIHIYIHTYITHLSRPKKCDRKCVYSLLISASISFLPSIFAAGSASTNKYGRLVANSEHSAALLCSW